MKIGKLENFKDVETILQRINRRTAKKVVGLAPAVPLYAFCAVIPENGIILRYMFPLPGRISRIIVHAPGVKSDAPLLIHAELVRDKEGQYVDVSVRKESVLADVDLLVQEGDRLVVTTPALNMENLEVGALFFPTFGVAEVHQSLIAELEKDSTDEGV